MPGKRTIEIMHRLWGPTYQAPDLFPRPGVHVAAETDAPADGVLRIHLLRRDGELLALAPPELVSRVQEFLKRTGAGVEPEPWSELTGCRILKAVGPAWIGMADASDFRPDQHSHSVRELKAEDAEALRRLGEACSREEWEHGAMDEEQVVRFGLFAGEEEGEELAAAAGYQLWGKSVAHICVVAHPAHRGHGYGSAVASAATRRALNRGLVAQYRTLRSNAGSMGIARRLGFQEYGETLTLRVECGGRRGGWHG